MSVISFFLSLVSLQRTPSNRIRKPWFDRRSGGIAAVHMPRRARMGLEMLECRDLLSTSIQAIPAPPGSPIFVPALPSAINDAGQVIAPGYVWSAATGYSVLKPAKAGGQAVPKAINDAGEIVGYTEIGSRDLPTVWAAGTHQPSLLAQLSGLNEDGSTFTTNTGKAVAINAAGQVVGEVGTPVGGGFTSVYPVLWGDSGQQPYQLDLFYQGSSFPSFLGPTDIDNNGDVVGDTIGDGPYVLKNNSGYFSLYTPTLPRGYDHTGGDFISDDGTVLSNGYAASASPLGTVVFSPGSAAVTLPNFMTVGFNDNDIAIGYEVSGFQAVPMLWSPLTGVVPLAQFLLAGSGWQLGAATGINSHNQVVGDGTFHGLPDAFVLTLPSFKPVDLAAGLDDAHITPAQAHDLHLHEFFGGEQVTVPVSVQDLGPNPANGTVKVNVYLSTATTLTTSAKPIKVMSEPIDLAVSGQVSFPITVTIPNTLKAGQKYYVVARISSSDLYETDARPGPDTNNLVASTTAYDFLGSPPAHVSLNTPSYFQFVRDTLKGTLAAQQQSPGLDVSNAQAFISAWVGDSLWPYLNAGVPMIGIGINLRTVSGVTKTDLAAAVRAYYQANIDPKFNRTDNQIIAMLIRQALPGDPKNPAHHAPQALTASDDQKLFTDLFTARAAIAQKAVGTAWTFLSTTEQVGLVDEVYRTGGIPAAVATALTAQGGPNYAWAGFALLASVPIPAAGSARLRIEAEYQNLLTAHTMDLGEMV
jgi:hypothetical protein